MRIIRIKNYEKNKNALKINKKENNNDKYGNDKMIFSNFRKNRKNIHSMENKNIESINSYSLNYSFPLFKTKKLYKIMENNTLLKQNIIIKKSIIQNDFNINKK